MNTLTWPAHTTQFRFESASVKLIHMEEYVYALSNLYSKERRKGHASGLLQLVTEWADAHRVALILVAQGYGPPNQPHPDNKQLVKLYSRFGFQVLGVDRATNRPRTMLRYPKTTTQGTVES